MAVVLAAAALFCITALGVAGRDLDDPGLYYDEVFQALPALEWLSPGGGPPRLPGMRAVRVLGRWLPWMTQPYMGALKSQLLIPVFALAPREPQVLRATTLVWALLGIPLVMLFANRALGLAVALLAGALLAVDPSLLFLARHDWGSFSIGFLLRGAALVLVTRGWRKGSRCALAGGGACLGLGVYNKIDFAVFVAAAAAALLVAARREVWQGVTRRRDLVLALAAGFALGIAPLALAAPDALTLAGQAARQAPAAGAWSEKWMAARTVLDGSYFQRLMLAGGRFERLGSVANAARGPGLVILAACALGLVAALARRRPADRGDAAARFVLATALLTLAGILATPRAVRAHHFLNATPFPQLVVATALVRLWTHAPQRIRLPARALAGLVATLAIGSALHIDVATLRTLRETGGRGRWSHAVETLARSLPAGDRAVSLDWGFDGPLRFTAPGIAAEEPIWRLWHARGGRVELEGTPHDVYLVWEPEYAVFPFGGELLQAIGHLPPETVRVERHRDREGEPVFRSIRFARDHRLVYRRGRIEVRLR